MIESARFTNVNGMTFDFNTVEAPFNSWTTEVDMRFTEKEKSQQHGLYPGDEWMGKRLWHAQGDLFADTSATYIQRRLAMIGAVLPRPQYGRKVAGTLDVLYSGMNEHLFSDCVLDGYPELPMAGASPARTSYQINWKAFDPRCYGPWRSVDILYNLAWQNLGGRGYDKTYNRTYSIVAGAQGDASITNSGNYDTAPLITFYGPVFEPSAVLFRSDGVVYNFMLHGVNLASVDEYAVADFQRRTVTHSNGSNLYNTAVGSDWWVLEPTPFSSTVRFSGTTLAVPAHMTVQWRNAYMI